MKQLHFLRAVLFHGGDKYLTMVFSLFLLCRQYHLNIQAISDLQYIHKILYAQLVGKTEDDGGIIQSGCPGCQFSFDIIERDLTVIDEVLFIFGDGNADLLFIDCLGRLGFGQQYLNDIGIGKGGNNQEKKQEKEHDVIQGRRGYFRGELLRPFNFHVTMN